MSDNNKLVAWIIGIFTSAFLLVIGVMAHDRQVERCIVDHLFDFHIDADHALSDIQKDRFRKDVEERMNQESHSRQKEWASEVREWWRDGPNYASDDRGAYGDNDRDCNRERN